MNRKWQEVLLGIFRRFKHLDCWWKWARFERDQCQNVEQNVRKEEMKANLQSIRRDYWWPCHSRILYCSCENWVNKIQLVVISSVTYIWRANNWWNLIQNPNTILAEISCLKSFCGAIFGVWQFCQLKHFEIFRCQGGSKLIGLAMFVELEKSIQIIWLVSTDTYHQRNWVRMMFLLEYSIEINTWTKSSIEGFDFGEGVFFQFLFHSSV